MFSCFKSSSDGFWLEDTRGRMNSSKGSTLPIKAVRVVIRMRFAFEVVGCSRWDCEKQVNKGALCEKFKNSKSLNTPLIQCRTFKLILLFSWACSVLQSFLMGHFDHVAHKAWNVFWLPWISRQFSLSLWSKWCSTLPGINSECCFLRTSTLPTWNYHYLGMKMVRDYWHNCINISF